MKQISIFIAVSLLLPLISYSCEDQISAPDTTTPGKIQAMRLRDGITKISDDSLAFVLFAPKKETVHLIGSFNDWQTSDEFKMERDGDRFWIKIGNLDPTKEYICQYLIDETIRIADPYCHKTSDPNDQYIPADVYPGLIPFPNGRTVGIAMTVSTKPESYAWQKTNFQMPKPKNLVVYELHLRDFTEKSSLKAALAKLPYLKTLGVNAIELMPFNEFEGNDSWGYNPSFYFAPDKAYGTPNDYKEFIDACHQNNMAVIMDMVLNHSYGQSPLVQMYMNGSKVSEDNPYYNVDSPNTDYSWGYDFNHESVYTQAFVDSVCAYWIKEYKIDGYRFDFTKGFTNKKGNGWAYDESRINILKRIANEIWKRKNDAYVILEHLTDNSEEKVLANYGIMLWGNMNYNTNEATMGWGNQTENGSYKGNLSGASYKQRGWNNPCLVAYMESHDEERLMYKNIQYGNAGEESGYHVKDTITGLQRNAAAAVIFLSIPGPKMIWQFGELGYDYSINYNDRVGRKPVRWDYYNQPARKALYDAYSQIIHLKTSREIFSTTDFSINLTQNFKSLTLRSASEKAIVIANFDVTPQTREVDFEQSGAWTEYFSNTPLNLSSTKENITLQPGEYRLYFSN
ncbi:MAG: alpha-amylase [Dysgonamonadaceae bacterium]|jgi:1,4-alpha-glucan branching enzyme|nr:alpha-amylase [Dysgonamonadaceae bacterium]